MLLLIACCSFHCERIHSSNLLFCVCSAKYAGIFTLLSYTVCPCLLNIFGRRRMVAEGLTENKNTYYHSIFSTSTWSWTLIVVSSLLIVGVIVESFL